jgi:hypothetical protein
MEGLMMDALSGPSRRDLLGWGAGALAAGLAGCRVGIAQPLLKTVPVLTVGDVNVRGVMVQPINMGSPSVAMDKGFCKLLSGGINFRATIELDPRAGTKPTWWGELMLVQHVQFRHQHTLATTGKRECATSGGAWNLDGQDPYLNKRVQCAPGPTSISHADDPGTFTEDAMKKTFEEVDVIPLDRFRTYVIWETTDNSLPPSSRNPARRHVVARVDWNWKAVALDPPSGAPQCKSTTFAPNAWGTQAAASDSKVFYGKDAVADPLQPKRPIMPPPGARLSAAMPEAWRPGRC